MSCYMDFQEGSQMEFTDKNAQENLGWKKNVVLYLHDIVFLLILIMLIFLLPFRIIVVSGDSMYSTLVDGDYLLLLSNLLYHEPDQGDIVVIGKKAYDDGAPIVKRVIAKEGQTVDIDFEEGIVYVDGVALEEDYTYSPTMNHGNVIFPQTVEENCIFVLGDNRGVSLDSRYPQIGQIDKREILGKALFLFLPGTHYGQLSRDFERIGATQ